MNRPADRRPLAHVPAAAAVSGALAVLLAVGLDALGVSGRLDEWLAVKFPESFVKRGCSENEDSL